MRRFLNNDVLDCAKFFLLRKRIVLVRRPSRKFCVSDFRQSQEFLVENTHYLAYFPCPPSPQRGAAVCAPGRREYRHSPPGNTSPRELASLPVGEHDLQLAEYQVPVLTPGMPVLHDAL